MSDEPKLPPSVQIALGFYMGLLWAALLGLYLLPRP